MADDFERFEDVHNRLAEIGRTRLVRTRLGSLCILCRILDVRKDWGHWRVRVEPVDGRGSAVIDASRVDWESTA